MVDVQEHKSLKRRRREEAKESGSRQARHEAKEVEARIEETPADKPADAKSHKALGKKEKKARLQELRDDAIRARKVALESSKSQDGEDEAIASLPTTEDHEKVEGKQPSEFVPIPQPLPRIQTAQEERALKTLGTPSWLAHPQNVPADETVSVDDMPDVSSRLKKVLKEEGITFFFAVQCAAIAHLVKEPLLYPRNLSERHGPADYSVSAPTGSGKTLAYTLPIIQILEKRQVVRLRALIIVPTRDLATQVLTTFKTYCKGTNLVVVASSGQHSFSAEQATLVGSLACPGDWRAEAGFEEARPVPPLGGQSKVDILITTPGRLVDHIQGTPGFTLQHLRFLVIDEADRLVAQQYQDWCPIVLDALKPSYKPLGSPSPSSGFLLNGPDGVAPSHLETFLHPSPYADLAVDYYRPAVQKLLFSATITKSPATISELELVNPRYISVRTRSSDQTMQDGEYAIPDTLKQSYMMTTTVDKPLALIHLLHSREIKAAIIFTNTVEASHRLSSLLQSYFDLDSNSIYRSDQVAHISSDQARNRRRRLLEACRSGKIRLLVASDLMARGIDLPDIAHVISYDVPGDLRRHVHRIGRTARAGRIGHALTLVEQQEAKYFLQLVNEGGREVKRIRIKEEALAPLRRQYEMALAKLAQAVAG